MLAGVLATIGPLAVKEVHNAYILILKLVKTHTHTAFLCDLMVNPLMLNVDLPLYATINSQAVLIKRTALAELLTPQKFQFTPLHLGPGLSNGPKMDQITAISNSQELGFPRDHTRSLRTIYCR